MFLDRLAGLVPFLAVFAATAQIRNRQHTAHLHPCHVRNRKLRRDRDIEAAVGVQQRWPISVQFKPLLVRDDHRHARTVLTRIEHLLALELRWIEIDFRLLPNATVASLQIVVVDTRRHGVAGKRIEGFRVRLLAAETASSAKPRQTHVAHMLPLKREDANL